MGNKVTVPDRVYDLIARVAEGGVSDEMTLKEIELENEATALLEMVSKAEPDIKRDV